MDGRQRLSTGVRKNDTGVPNRWTVRTDTGFVKSVEPVVQDSGGSGGPSVRFEVKVVSMNGLETVKIDAENLVSAKIR